LERRWRKDFSDYVDGPTRLGEEVTECGPFQSQVAREEVKRKVFGDHVK
jgi:hypothetical protein